jgi:hypothetical protein
MVFLLKFSALTLRPYLSIDDFHAKRRALVAGGDEG